MKLYLARYLLPVYRRPIEDGALLVREDRIAAVGRRRDVLAVSTGAQVIDFGEAVLLPPLVNAHAHLELTHFPRWAARAGETGCPETFVDWVLQVIRVKRQVAENDYAPSIRAGIGEALRAGTGAVGDILSCYPAHAVHQESPLRGILFLEILGRDHPAMRRLLGRVRDLLAEEKAGFLQFGLSPHSPYTLSAENLGQALETARRMSIPLAIHLGESAAESEFLANSSGPLAEVLYPFVGWRDQVPKAVGRSPVEYLAERGGLGARSLLVHGVQVGRADIERLARTESPVVLCPRSNARLGVGRAPLGAYLQAGVPLALGTDSLASVDSLSVWDELAFAHQWFAGEGSPRQLLEIATRGGAKALALEGDMGVLETGRRASFQVLKPAELPSLGQLEEFLCAPGRTAEVRHLFLDGRDVLP